MSYVILSGPAMATTASTKKYFMLVQIYGTEPLPVCAITVDSVAKTNVLTIPDLLVVGNLVEAQAIISFVNSISKQHNNGVVSATGEEALNVIESLALAVIHDSKALNTLTCEVLASSYAGPSGILNNVRFDNSMINGLINTSGLATTANQVTLNMNAK